MWRAIDRLKIGGGKWKLMRVTGQENTFAVLHRGSGYTNSTQQARVRLDAGNGGSDRLIKKEREKENVGRQIVDVHGYRNALLMLR